MTIITIIIKILIAQDCGIRSDGVDIERGAVRRATARWRGGPHTHAIMDGVFLAESRQSVN